MNKDLEKCPLCNAFTSKGKHEFFNTILFETKNFVLVPSVGPLDLGLFAEKRKRNDLLYH